MFVSLWKVVYDEPGNKPMSNHREEAGQGVGAVGL